MSDNWLSGDDKKFLNDLIDDLKEEKANIITNKMQEEISQITDYHSNSLTNTPKTNKLMRLTILFANGLLILNDAIDELNSIESYMNSNDMEYNDENIIELDNKYDNYKLSIGDFVSGRKFRNNSLIDKHLNKLHIFSRKYPQDGDMYNLIMNIEMIFNVIVNLLMILPILSNITNDVEKSSVQTGQPGGFRKKNNLKPTVVQSKEILGKIRRIYKVAGSRKEHIKYKGELISVSDYKKLVSQAKALKSQNKPVAKPKAKPATKSATKPKAKPATKTKPKAKSATKSKAK